MRQPHTVLCFIHASSCSSATLKSHRFHRLPATMYHRVKRCWHPGSELSRDLHIVNTVQIDDLNLSLIGQRITNLSTTRPVNHSELSSTHLLLNCDLSITVLSILGGIRDPQFLEIDQWRFITIYSDQRRQEDENRAKEISVFIY